MDDDLLMADEDERAEGTMEETAERIESLSGRGVKTEKSLDDNLSVNLEDPFMVCESVMVLDKS